LPAEVMLDAVTAVTGSPEVFEGLPDGSQAVRTWNNKLPSIFLDTFGRPNSSADCPCERVLTPTMTQTLHLLNSDAIVTKLALTDSTAGKLAQGNLPTPGLIEEAYLRTYARFPSADELMVASRILPASGTAARPRRICSGPCSIPPNLSSTTDPMNRNCNGIGRRAFLQTGLGALGGLSLTEMLRVRAEAGVPSDTRCIFIWLDGGPSHYETFDPKPDAPGGIRGEFKSIPTSVPGVHFSEHVPNLAKAFDKFTGDPVDRPQPEQPRRGNHYLTTGRPTPVPVGCGAFVTFHPSFGSVVAADRGVVNGMPAYFNLGSMARSGGPSFLGASNAPFVISDSPSQKNFRVRDVSIPQTLDPERAGTRRQLRAELDRLTRINDTVAEDPAVALDSYYEQAYRLVYSPGAQAAFDISQEPDAVRDAYGRNDVGQRLLLARRLTEAGVPFVTVYYGGWDHHEKIFPKLKDEALPKTDQGVAALINDLHQRGTLDNTLVVLLGEFGRTPKINEKGGRDHWSFAMSVLMAGAGIPGGQIVGATDVKGYYASETIYRPEDFAGSIYTKMGIDHTRILHDTANRPVQLVDRGGLIKELFA